MRTFPKDLKYFQKDDYFFAVVLGMESAGYLIHERLGQCFFVELMVQRPGFKDEVQQIAEGFGVQVMQGYATRQAEQSDLRPIEKINRLGGSIVFGARQPPRVHLNVNIANGLATASWRLDDCEQKESAHLKADTTPLHDAQSNLLRATLRGNPTQIGDASTSLGTALSQHLFQGAMASQFNRALSEMNRVGGALELQLEFGGEENLAQLSWELLRAPYAPHNFLCTLPGLMVTRRYPNTILPFRLPDTPKKLLIVLGEELARPEAMAAKKLWEDNCLLVRLLERPDSYELADALLEGPWDVVHFITHGEVERIIIKDTLHSSQLANMVQGNVRTAAVLSVCNSALADAGFDQVPVDHYERGTVAWRGVAQALIGAGVPNVIAWSNLAYLADCARITPRWHAEYLTSGDARKATQIARKAIFAAEEYSFGWLAHFTA